MSVMLANHLEADSANRALRNDVRHGLAQTPKSLPPKWFYDEVGSDLFDQITRLPEYYPTRAEAAILRVRAASIAEAIRVRAVAHARDRNPITRFAPDDASHRREQIDLSLRER